MNHYYETISWDAAIQQKQNMMQYLVHYNALNMHAHFVFKDDMKRKAVALMAKASHTKACNSLRDAIIAEHVSQGAYVALLKAVPLKTKCEVAKAMAIIPTPAAAAFLGVSEARLREMKDKALFGDMYMGRQCFSKDELTLLAMNPGWLARFGPIASTEEIELPDASSLDGMTFVDEDFATAYTEMNICELEKQIKPSQRRYGTYGLKRQIRLSELEKIRMAKLKAAA